MKNFEQLRFCRSKLNPIVKCELHGFSVASLRAYGATIYVKTILESGKAHTNFFTAKSRIVPLKEITIPRLELSGGNLFLSHLTNSIRIAIEKDVQIDKIYYWTDPMVCLSWINSEKSFNVFVDNRVKEIKRLSNCESENNPTDLSTKIGFPLS